MRLTVFIVTIVSLYVVSCSGQGEIVGRALSDSCDAETYLKAYNYENAKLFEYQARCKAQIKTLIQQQFSPPTSFEVMNMVCKGDCRIYMSRLKRLFDVEQATNCSCADVHNRCPRPAQDMLCDITGWCRPWDLTEADTCAVNACGRWVNNEVDYREVRKKCGLNFDASTKAAISISVLAVIGAAIAKVLFSTYN